MIHVSEWLTIITPIGRNDLRQNDSVQQAYCWIDARRTQGN